MSRVFVSSAAGTIGTALLARLHGEEIHVIAGVHSQEKANILTKTGVEARVFDYEDAASLEAAMRHCTKMVLTLPLTEKMTRYGHLAVEAAKTVGIGYIVRTSVYAASSDAHWRLGREHGMVDQFVEDSGIPYTVLRPNLFMQNFSTHMAAMVKSGVVALAEDDAKVSYIDIHDVAACIARLLLDVGEHENKFYAMTGPEGLSGADVARILSEATGREIAYRALEEEAYVAGLTELGIPKWNRNMLTSLSRVVKLGMIGNVTKAVEYLTGKPARTFEAFAEECAYIWK